MVFESNIKSMAHFLSDKKLAFFVDELVEVDYSNGEFGKRYTTNGSYDCFVEDIRLSGLTQDAYGFSSYKIVPIVDVFIGSSKSIVKVSIPETYYDVKVRDVKYGRDAHWLGYMIEYFEFSYEIENSNIDEYSFVAERDFLIGKISEELNRKINQFVKFNRGNRSKTNGEWELSGVSCSAIFEARETV